MDVAVVAVAVALLLVAGLRVVGGTVLPAASRMPALLGPLDPAAVRAGGETVVVVARAGDARCPPPSTDGGVPCRVVDLSREPDARLPGLIRGLGHDPAVPLSLTRDRDGRIVRVLRLPL